MQRALVTGASRGIGRALVADLAGRGLEVVATARRVDDLTDLPAAQRLPLDVTSDSSVAAAVRAAGRIDVLVNNAAVSVAAPVEDTPAPVALAMFDTNVVGPLRLISAFLPGMRERGGGMVVNVSSEAGPVGIRVLVVQLGGVATGMYERQERYFSPAYAHLDRAQKEAFEQVRAHGASPEQVAGDIADAIAATDGRLRVPIGQDAAWMLAERARLDDAAWIARVREVTQPTKTGGPRP